MLVLRKSAVHKLRRLTLHAGTRPALVPGTDWAGDWYGFYLFAAYTWTWNSPSRQRPLCGCHSQPLPLRVHPADVCVGCFPR